MARLSPSIFIKKRLREDDHKDELTLDRTPASGGGSRKVGLSKETERVVVERQTPVRGRNQERPFQTN